jgi:UDP-N-acetylmuramate dehydrogenase
MTHPGALAHALEEVLDGEVDTDRDLGPLTTYRVGGAAALYVEPASVEDLEAVGRVLRGSEAEDLPVLPLGRGSNIVISDEGFPGLVIRLASAFSRIEVRSDGEDGLVAGGSTPLPTLANWAARRGLAGLEFLIAIPGSVGGAVRMNAGAHGREIRDSLASVRLFDLDLMTVDVRDASTLGFRYRGSDLTDRHVVVDATFNLTHADRDEVRERMESYRRHRAETQPGALQNAGSTFKNPPGDHAGRLVEAAGLKGFAVGGASVSTLHANFFMASEEATSQDVYDLVHEVQARVRDRFDIELEPEIRFVGSFKSRSRERGGTVR